jgi:hypothetical protein
MMENVEHAHVQRAPRRALMSTCVSHISAAAGVVV